MSIDLGEHEAFIRKTLRIQFEDDDIGQGQLLDLYDYIVTGLDPDEELEATFVMYEWASITSARFTRASSDATTERRRWSGQVGVDLKSSGAKVTDTDVKHAIRAEAEWDRLSQDEAKYTYYADILRSFAIIMYKKADALIKRLGTKGDFNVRKKKKKKRRPA
jgi:hypothetical protein